MASEQAGTEGIMLARHAPPGVDPDRPAVEWWVDDRPEDESVRSEHVICDCSALEQSW